MNTFREYCVVLQHIFLYALLRQHRGSTRKDDGSRHCFDCLVYKLKKKYIFRLDNGLCCTLCEFTSFAPSWMFDLILIALIC